MQNVHLERVERVVANSVTASHDMADGLHDALYWGGCERVWMGGKNLGASDTGAGVCLLATSGYQAWVLAFPFLLGSGLELWILRDSCLCKFTLEVLPILT